MTEKKRQRKKSDMPVEGAAHAETLDVERASQADAEWAEADEQAMNAILLASDVDIEAAMEEDIAGIAEDVSRRNPGQTGLTAPHESDWSLLSSDALRQRPGESDAAAFLKFTGGTFPPLFRSREPVPARFSPPEAEEPDDDDAPE